jgi:hypothetical protein
LNTPTQSLTRAATVDDDLFGRLRQYCDDDTIAELTMIIAREDASSRFNRAFRVPSQGFWKRLPIRRRRIFTSD